jgi:hypothetical protein
VLSNLLTPLLRNCCFFGVFPILLAQHGEKFKIYLYAEMRNTIFDLLPLLIADEIGGVPIGRGG